MWRRHTLCGRSTPQIADTPCVVEATTCSEGIPVQWRNSYVAEELSMWRRHTPCTGGTPHSGQAYPV